MESYKNLKRGTKIGLCISVILVFLGLINCVFTFLNTINQSEATMVMHCTSDLVMYLLILIYALFEYKKPHGNMLKYVFLLFALYVVEHCIMPAEGLTGTLSYISEAVEAVAALSIAYMAGRLNRIEKNRFLMVFVGLLILTSNIIAIVTFPLNFLRILGVLTQVIVWVALCLAYVARYEEHLAAGLETSN